MVSDFIRAEGSICFVAAFMGMLLGLEYDCIRIFRRVIRHKHVWTMSLEDIIYWIVAAFQVFGLIYEQGDGVVRVFLVVTMVLGAILYRYAFGRFLVVYVSKILNFIFRPLKKLISSVTIKARNIRVAQRQACEERQVRRRQRRAARKRSRKDEAGVKKRKGNEI